MKTLPLSLGCAASLQYQASGGTDCPLRIQTSGAIGAEYVPLPGLDAVGVVRLLYVSTTQPVRLRVDAGGARLEGSGATYPFVAAGGEVFTFAVDGVSISHTFSAGSYTAEQVRNLLNSEAASAGLLFAPVTVLTSGDNSGQLLISGVKTGVDGSVAVTAALAGIGFASVTSVQGTGVDLDLEGPYLQTFPRTAEVQRVEISGFADVETFVAGDA